MAKKNLSSLMSGIMGTDERERTEANPSASEEIRQIPLEKESVPVAPRKPGRPKKDEAKKEIRATFIVDPELVRKVKYISLMDDRLQKDVINDALTEYISNWESEHGKIKMQK